MKKYPAEIREFIENNAAGTRPADLVTMVNDKFGTAFNYKKMCAFLKNHKIRTGTTNGLAKGAPTKLYPAEVREFIQKNYVGVGHQGMADLLNKKFGTQYTKGQMKSWYSRMKLNSGRTGRFKKGNEPANKGKKGIHLSPQTEFKKGHRPHNHLPVGTEIWRQDRRKKREIEYLYVKIAEPNVWAPKHRLIWEAAHGPLPKGTKIVFADRNPRNLSLDNLIALSGSELARMNQNGLFFGDPEATKVGVTIAKIKARSGELSRKKKEVHREQ